MTEPGLPYPIEEQEDTFLRNIHRLFFRPRAYFEGIKAPKKKGWLFIFALTYGLAWAISRGDANSASGVPGATSWAEHWLLIIAGGVIGMLFSYYLGGAWYRFRLGVCGAAQEDKGLVRRVYLSAAQVLALPMIALEIVSTLRFPSPAAAEASPAGETMLILGLAILFQLWSWVVSYVGVRTVFKVGKLCAAAWFLVLPILFLALLIGAIFLLGAAENAPDVPKADVSAPREFSGSDLVFSYARNWRVTDSSPSTGGKAKVEIQGEGGAYFLAQSIETADSAESFSVKWVESMKETLTLPTEPKPFDTWGTLKGVGQRFEDQGGDSPSEFRLFVAPVAEGQLLMICETFPTALKGRIEPGFKLIRKTFRMIR